MIRWKNFLVYLSNLFCYFAVVFIFDGEVGLFLDAMQDIEF